MKVVTKYVGESSVPQDVKRRRRQVFDAMNRFGTPVVVKHMWNPDDVEKGTAVTSPGFDTVYGQGRNRDPLSHGIGYVSAANSEDEWYNTTTGEIVVDEDDPGVDWVPAPKYRGFGEGHLLYVIEPDRAEDVFKVNEIGVFIQTQTALVQAPWFPEIKDNDLIIHVILDAAGNIIETKERFQAKQTSPTSLRGLDRRGRREYTEDGGNRHVVGQSFEMTLIPSNDELYNVETDR